MQRKFSPACKQCLGRLQGTLVQGERTGVSKAHWRVSPYALKAGTNPVGWPHVRSSNLQLPIITTPTHRGSKFAILRPIQERLFPLRAQNRYSGIPGVDHAPFPAERDDGIMIWRPQEQNLFSIVDPCQRTRRVKAGGEDTMVVMVSVTMRHTRLQPDRPPICM